MVNNWITEWRPEEDNVSPRGAWHPDPVRAGRELSTEAKTDRTGMRRTTYWTL